MICSLRFISAHYVRRSLMPLTIIFIILYMSIGVMIWNRGILISNGTEPDQRKRPEIWIITPTGKRHAQLADLTRFSQTLSLVSDIHWILVEDAEQKTEKIEALLTRISVPSTHLFFKTPRTFPGRGWAQRNYALAYLRKRFKNTTDSDPKRIIYFADDDNTYDVRMFENYIRKVKRIGVWPVAFAGGAFVEAPKVNQDSVVIGWNTVWASYRPFAIDMAGFAVNIDLILKFNATFEARCHKRKDGPETCFLEQFGLKRTDLEPFGVNDKIKEVLVWHTRTEQYRPLQLNSTFGYIF